jgi:hypothetical protein
VPDWNWWQLTMYIMKTIATLLAFVAALYACKLTNYWRGWVLVSLGLGTAPFIGVFQILSLLGIPSKGHWDTLTGLILPWISMMLVSWGTYEVVKQIKAILKLYKRG